MAHEDNQIVPEDVEVNGDMEVNGHVSEDLDRQQTTNHSLCICSQPWWFLIEELDRPLVFYLDAWMEAAIFGMCYKFIPDMQWLRQTLVLLNKVDDGRLMEIALFGERCSQYFVMNVFLDMADLCQQRFDRIARMILLEEFLETNGSGLNAEQMERFHRTF